MGPNVAATEQRIRSDFLDMRHRYYSMRDSYRDDLDLAAAADRDGDDVLAAACRRQAAGLKELMQKLGLWHG